MRTIREPLHDRESLETRSPRNSDLPFLRPAFSLQPQTSASGLSGSIISTSGVAVSAASVSAKNLNTGESAQTQTDAAGHFSLPQPVPGDYEVSVTAPGFSNLVVKTMVAPGVGGTIDLALSAQAPAPGNLPNAPSSSQTEPSLSDLGFTPEQTQSNAKEQALLDKRTRMLKIHQKLGLITVAPLVATVVTSLGVVARKPATPIARSTSSWERFRVTCTSPRLTLRFARPA